MTCTSTTSLHRRGTALRATSRARPVAGAKDLRTVSGSARSTAALSARKAAASVPILVNVAISSVLEDALDQSKMTA